METPAGAPVFSALWSAGVGAWQVKLQEPVKKSRILVIPSKRSALRDLRILLSLAVNPVPGSFDFTQDDSAADYFGYKVLGNLKKLPSWVLSGFYFGVCVLKIRQYAKYSGISQNYSWDKISHLKTTKSGFFEVTIPYDQFALK